MNSNTELIETLTRSELFRNYERAYNDVTGMPLTLRPLETWRLLFHGKRKENAFCAIMAQKSKTCAACLQVQKKLAHDAIDKPATRTCAYGLCELAVPVKLGRETIGFLQTGQVMRHKATEEPFQQAVHYARTLGVEIDTEETRQAFFATPVASPAKLESVSNLLITFADHLSMKSNQIVVQSANAEPPAITKAKQFIDQHSMEHLSLSQVAQAVHMNIFYFCKFFRKGTGLTFTQFVSRTRLEKAKNLLLNPHSRVSEIAFESGFQSLSHFNRTFQQILGQSPTEYRKMLPQARLKWAASGGYCRINPSKFRFALARG